LCGFSLKNNDFNAYRLIDICLGYLKRNGFSIFFEKEESLIRLIDKVKFKSFWWMKAKSFAFIYDINQRWANALVYRVIVVFACLIY